MNIRLTVQTTKFAKLVSQQLKCEASLRGMNKSMCSDDHNDGFDTAVGKIKISTEVVNKNVTSVEVDSSKPVELNSASNAKLTDIVNFKDATVESPSKTANADETTKIVKKKLIIL